MLPVALVWGWVLASSSSPSTGKAQLLSLLRLSLGPLGSLAFSQSFSSLCVIAVRVAGLSTSNPPSEYVLCLVAVFLSDFGRGRDCLWCTANISERELSNINTAINAPEHGPRQTDCTRCEKHKAYLYLESNASQRKLLCKLSSMAMALQAPFA